MKITQEQFGKLKQLDRIEYRQKARNIEDIHDKCFGWMFMKGVIFLIAFLCLIIPQGYSVWGIEFVIDISNVLISLIVILSVFGLIGCGIDLVLYITQIKNLKELQEKYFKVEVKK